MHRSKTSVVKCGTCEYWTGERTPAFGKNSEAIVIIQDEYGECQCEYCAHTGAKRKESNRCKSHSKWTELL